MASSVPTDPAVRIAQALVDFTDHGAFPEEDVSSLPIRTADIPAAIEALAQAKVKLEAEIHTINEATAADVRVWKQNAKSVQDDIARSKALANDILKQSEAPDTSATRVAEIEGQADFLTRELSYNGRVRDALRGIREVGQLLDRVETACEERRIPEALGLLEESWAALNAIPVSRSVRAMKLLDIRASELKAAVHGVFDRVWKTLVHVDVAGATISITQGRDDESMNLSDAVIGLKAYKEVNKRAIHLWHDLDSAFLAPRMDFARGEFFSVKVEGDVLSRHGTADASSKSLFADLEQILSFLVQRLPPDLIAALSAAMMPEIVTRIATDWLEAAVPASLRDMDRFQEVIETVGAFCATLEALGLTGVDDLREWAENAPRVWLAKCRAAALDSVRTKLSQGLGASQKVERVEKQQVSKSEQKELAATGAMAVSDDHGWDAAWSDGEGGGSGVTAQTAGQVGGSEDDGTDAWGWGEEENVAADKQEEKADDEDDPSEAWGWGDDANSDEPGVPTTSQRSVPAPAPEQTRELTLRETYNISSMPEPVLSLIFAILEDGAMLTQDEYANSPVATAAAGLFNLPTLALAMFRAISPYYYALDNGGSMYLYNDATYIAERLADFAAAWKKRDDLNIRAQSMLRLDNDIKSLQRFAARAYSNEMTVQKTVLRDLLGSDQNLMLQAGKESSVENAVAQVRSVATMWEGILARSAWYQAIGALVDTVAAKLVADVMDMPGIGQDEAYAIAGLIATVTELDDLFLPSRVASSSTRPGGAGAGGGDSGGDEIPTTAQYAASWLRLKYLSEVLQSNLKDVRYLWMESELSLYFSAEEVVELINLSFEDNPRTRDVIRQVKQNPRPMGHEEGEGGGDW